MHFFRKKPGKFVLLEGGFPPFPLRAKKALFLSRSQFPKKAERDGKRTKEQKREQYSRGGGGGGDVIKSDIICVYWGERRGGEGRSVIAFFFSAEKRGVAKKASENVLHFRKAEKRSV